VLIGSTDRVVAFVDVVTHFFVKVKAVFTCTFVSTVEFVAYRVSKGTSTVKVTLANVDTSIDAVFILVAVDALTFMRAKLFDTDGIVAANARVGAFLDVAAVVAIAND